MYFANCNYKIFLAYLYEKLYLEPPSWVAVVLAVAADSAPVLAFLALAGEGVGGEIFLRFFFSLSLSTTALSVVAGLTSLLVEAPAEDLVADEEEEVFFGGKVEEAAAEGFANMLKGWRDFFCSGSVKSDN